MKKAILTFGLFSLVMVLTSFTTTETNNTSEMSSTVSVKSDIIGAGSTGINNGGNIKADIIGAGSTGINNGGNIKADIIGAGSTGINNGGNIKAD